MNNMKKVFLLGAMLCVLEMMTACKAQGEKIRLSADASVLYATVDGKEMAFPKLGDGFYALETTFVQNDTTFLYREYSFDSVSGKFIRSSYFIEPRNAPDYQENLKNTIYMWDSVEDAEYFAAMLEEQHEYGSPFVRNDLGDMPRIWYNVMKYDGRYFISVDNPWTIEIRDTVYILHGMELGICALRNVRKEGESYRYEYEEHYYSHDWCSVEYTPVHDVKGLWIGTVNFGGILNKEYLTTREEAANFDIINWQSDDHENVGLSRYENTE